MANLVVRRGYVMWWEEMEGTEDREETQGKVGMEETEGIELDDLLVLLLLLPLHYHLRHHHGDGVYRECDFSVNHIINKSRIFLTSYEQSQYPCC